MQTTLTVAANVGCSPFDVFAQEFDEVAMLINYYLILGADEKATKPEKKQSNKQVRIRVNDATATGGWY